MCVHGVFCVLVPVHYASHCTLLTGCVRVCVCVCVCVCLRVRVCYVCVLPARVYLFIYLFLADHRKRKAEGKEKGTEAGSISVFLCVHSARLCVYMDVRKEKQG